jgi:IMP cyclohydrolase
MVRNYESISPDANRLNYVLMDWRRNKYQSPRVTTAATTNKLFSDYFVEDASYIRIFKMSVRLHFKSSCSEIVGSLNYDCMLV